MSAARDAVAERGRRTIRLPQDGEWLTRAIADKLELPASERVDLRQLIALMAKRQHLYRIRRGRYVVAPDGTVAVQQAAPAELLIDLVLGEQGDYYVSHLSALIAHRLTDLHSSDSYAAIRQSSTFREQAVKLADGMLHISKIADNHWPAPETLHRARVFSGAREFAWQASVELALVDAVARPNLCAGFETVVLAWSRATGRSTDWDAVARIASSRDASTARRVAFLLGLFHFDDVVERLFPTMRGRGHSIPLDRSRSYDVPGKLERDAKTGVVLNIPRDLLRAWARPPVG